MIDGVLDGLIYAGLVGIGFAFVENIGYYASSYLGSSDIAFAGAEGVTTTFVVRGVFSPLAHPLFTAAFGIALGYAITRKSKVLRVVICTLGLAVSLSLHGLWNGSLSYGPDSGLGFVLAYLVLAAVLMGVTVLAIVVRMRQVQILERSLAYVADRGWIHPAEIPYLSRFGYRKAARRFAKANYGKAAARTVKRVPGPRDRDGLPARRVDERTDQAARRRTHLCAARCDVRAAPRPAIAAGTAQVSQSHLTGGSVMRWLRVHPESSNLCVHPPWRRPVDERSSSCPATTLRPSSSRP